MGPSSDKPGSTTGQCKGHSKPSDGVAVGNSGTSAEAGERVCTIAVHALPPMCARSCSISSPVLWYRADSAHLPRVTVFLNTKNLDPRRGPDDPRTNGEQREAAESEPDHSDQTRSEETIDS